MQSVMWNARADRPCYFPGFDLPSTTFASLSRAATSTVERPGGPPEPAVFPLHPSGGRLPQPLDTPLPVRAVPEDLLAADTLPEAIVAGQASRRYPVADLLLAQLGQLAAADHAAGLSQRQAQLAEDVGQL